MKDAIAAMDVAANIRAELGRQRVTYRDFAKQLAEKTDLKLSEETLRRRLIGQTRLYADEVPAIAEALGVSVAVLLGEEARAS